jgi:hypothetical protein
MFMAEKYAWSRRSDDEIWRGGPCATIRECVEEALAEGYQLTDTFAIGIIEPYSIDTYFADMIIDRLQEHAYDEVGEVSDGWLDYVSKEDVARLDERLSQIIFDWLKEVKEEPTFYSIAPCHDCTLAEAIEMHKERTINTPKGGKFNLEEGN